MRLHRIRFGWITAAVASAVLSAFATAGARAALIVPAYSSLPGASTKLYIDFDGDNTPSWGPYFPGVTPAYSTDPLTTDFSPQELTNIEQIWKGVSEKYSPFNINVTTVDPGNQNNYETMRIIVGGSGEWAPAGAGGIAEWGSYVNNAAPNFAFVFPGHLGNGNPRYVAEAVAHEAGHTFQLKHQSSYDENWELVEYHPGDAFRAPIMGRSYFSQRGLWWNGMTETGNSQDDLAILSKTNVQFANNFGYRADDHGNTLALAHPLAVGPDFLLAGFGVIERTNDADYFQFTTPGGAAHLAADVASFAPMLDLTLRLYDSDDGLLASSATASLGEFIDYDLAPGTYRLGVFSAGNYGDIGQYFISGTAVPEPASAALVLLLFAPALARRRIR